MFVCFLSGPDFLFAGFHLFLHIKNLSSFLLIFQSILFYKLHFLSHNLSVSHSLPLIPSFTPSLSLYLYLPIVYFLFSFLHSPPPPHTHTLTHTHTHTHAHALSLNLHLPSPYFPLLLSSLFSVFYFRLAVVVG